MTTPTRPQGGAQQPFRPQPVRLAEMTMGTKVFFVASDEPPDKTLAREVLRLHEPDEALVERVARALGKAEAQHHGTATAFCACGWVPVTEPYVEETHHERLDQQVAAHRQVALARAALAALREPS